MMFKEKLWDMWLTVKHPTVMAYKCLRGQVVFDCWFGAVNPSLKGVCVHVRAEPQNYRDEEHSVALLIGEVDPRKPETMEAARVALGAFEEHWGPNDENVSRMRLAFDFESRWPDEQDAPPSAEMES